MQWLFSEVSLMLFVIDLYSDFFNDTGRCYRNLIFFRTRRNYFLGDPIQEISIDDRVVIVLKLLRL